jgi:pimeloyl-ACP methyl ester carboxylesterase
MPHLTSDDGVKLFYEETGSGIPIEFVHEFAGDWRSWEAQLRYFGRRYRAIAYNARGYPPSDVPEDVNAYSQEQAAQDIVGLLRHLSIPHAHLVGLSMGGYAVLHVGLLHPSVTNVEQNVSRLWAFLKKWFQKS